MKKVLLVVALVLFAGCAEDGSPLFEEDAGADGGDSDSDTDSDSDSDTDSDTDTDEEYDTDCADGCTDPPPDSCDEEGYLLQYSGASSCIEDVCEYEFEVILCGYACVEVADDDDHCQDDICEGVVCDDPPDDECTFDGLLLGYEDIGWCDPDGDFTGTVGSCYYPTLPGAEGLGLPQPCPEGLECIIVSGSDDYCA